MLSEPANAPVTQERLSSLVDGELDADGIAQLCGRWREDAGMRADWHAYHLIGDVLRSDDLASHAGHDGEFLARLRDRLAQEPVVLAPALSPAAPVRRPRWVAPTAVAAGFLAVAGVVVVMRATQPAAAPVPLAQGKAPESVQPVAAAVPAEADLITGAVIRDARLDLYLAAHKQFIGSSALGMPAGFLRGAPAAMPDR